VCSPNVATFDRARNPPTTAIATAAAIAEDLATFFRTEGPAQLSPAHQRRALRELLGFRRDIRAIVDAAASHGLTR